MAIRWKLLILYCKLKNIVSFEKTFKVFMFHAVQSYLESTFVCCIGCPRNLFVKLGKKEKLIVAIFLQEIKVLFNDTYNVSPSQTNENFSSQFSYHRWYCQEIFRGLILFCMKYEVITKSTGATQLFLQWYACTVTKYQIYVSSERK